MRRLVVIAFAAALLAGCGGTDSGEGIATASSGAASPTVTASAGANDADQGRKFAQCMRDNGVPDFPDPGPDGTFAGGDPESMRAVLDSDKGRAALDKCRDLAPGGGEGRELDPAQQEQLRQWAQCMRDNGVDVPDPDPNSGSLFGGEGQLPFDTNDPTFQKAMEACQDKFTFRQGQGS
jgi:hypothetical protein